MAKKKSSAFSAELLDDLLKDQGPATTGKGVRFICHLYHGYGTRYYCSFWAEPRRGLGA